VGSIWILVVHINTGNHILGTGLAYYCEYAIGWTMYDTNRVRSKRFSLLQNIQTSSVRVTTLLHLVPT